MAKNLFPVPIAERDPVFEDVKRLLNRAQVLGRTDIAYALRLYLQDHFESDGQRPADDPMHERAAQPAYGRVRVDR